MARIPKFNIKIVQFPSHSDSQENNATRDKENIFFELCLSIQKFFLRFF